MPTMNASGSPLLCADGTPADSTQRCCGIPQLMSCTTGAGSGIGLLPQHTPLGAAAGSTVQYNGKCYLIGAVATGLTQSTSMASLVPSCYSAACGNCPCPSGSRTLRSVASVTVVLSGFAPCVCNYRSTTGYFTYDSPSGVYTVPLSGGSGHVVTGKYANYYTDSTCTTISQRLPMTLSVGSSFAAGVVTALAQIGAVLFASISGCQSDVCLPCEGYVQNPSCANWTVGNGLVQLL